MSGVILRQQFPKFRMENNDEENIVLNDDFHLPNLINPVYDSDCDNEIINEPSDDIFELEEPELYDSDTE